VPALLLTHERYLDHDLGRGHPERPDRLRAVLAGIEAAGLGEAVTRAVPREATAAELARVHDGELVAMIERSSLDGGGWLDADTACCGSSYDAALLAAGAGLTAVEALDAAVTAAALADRGERVLIVDYDAHHGNGTQDVFWTDPRVAYASFHQWPLYPGTGGLREVGAGAGHGTTINLPLPAGATGDAFRAGVEEVLAPFASAFDPTWLLISAGFDAHRADPITDLGLSSGDYADLTADLLALVPQGRRIVFLEGGYDLDALGASAAACVAAQVGERLVPEPPTSGGPGREVIDAVALVQAEAAQAG
jgi:acetoin utilization deacetylase AcuC-like enzyme